MQVAVAELDDLLLECLERSAGPAVLQADPDRRLLPADLAAAEAVQDRVLRRLLAKGHGPIGAWKVGASTTTARKALGLERQFLGAVFAKDVLTAPARIDPAKLSQRGVELEWAFIVGRDLRARSAPYTTRQVLDAIAGVAPSIEIPGTRYSALGVLGGPALVADNGAAALVVVGAPVAEWSEQELLATPVCLRMRGVPIVDGSGRAILGGLTRTLVDHVNMACRRGYDIVAGQAILTGSCTPYHTPPMDVELSADFGRFGAIELRYAI